MRAVYDQSTGDAQSMFNQAAQRFADVLQGLKQMTAEMQHELDSTRSELRKGILELPQETAESAAQMRRVIVDQIEALAELNRIVARHGRNLDTVEPSARRADPVGRCNAAATRVHPGERQLARRARSPARRPRRAWTVNAVDAAGTPAAAAATFGPTRGITLAQPGCADASSTQRLALRPAHPRVAR
jgi:type VI protein secretion system component VasK